jgi:hypothetical protein
MDQLIKENKRLEIDLKGLKTDGAPSGPKKHEPSAAAPGT